MSEYIKREYAEKILFHFLHEEPPYIDSDLAIKRWTKEQFADVPNIDVVHCKECRYEKTCCRNIIDDPVGVPVSIDYCSYGEKKDETD